MKHKKILLCITLSLIMVVTAIYAAYQKPKEVKAAVVIDDAMAIIALLAACGVVYTGATWWQDGSAAEVWDDSYSDEIGEIKEGKLVPIFQECMERLNMGSGDDFDPEKDDPNDKVPSFEKLIQWIKLHPGETIMTTGTALAMVLLNFANALKDDADVKTEVLNTNVGDILADAGFVYDSCEFNVAASSGFNSFGCTNNRWLSYCDEYLNNNRLAFTSHFTKNNDGSYHYYYMRVFPAVNYGLVFFDSSGELTIGCVLEGSTSIMTLYNSNYESNGYVYNDPAKNAGYHKVHSGETFSFVQGVPLYYYIDGEFFPIEYNTFLDLNSDNIKYGSIVDYDEGGKISALPVSQINASALAENWPQILPALQNQLALGLDPAEKVDEIINTVGTATPTPPSIAPDIEQSPELEPLPEIEGVDGLDKGSFLLPDWITEKFPFCVPFDIIRAFSVLESTSRTAPKITLPLKAERYGIDYELDIDLAVFDEVAALLRSLELILFVIGLALVSRDLIKG